MKNKSLNLLINAMYKDQAKSIEINISESVSFIGEEFFECIVYLDNEDGQLIKKVVEVNVKSHLNDGSIKMNPNPVKKFNVGIDLIKEIIKSEFELYRDGETIITVEKEPTTLDQCLNDYSNVYDCLIVNDAHDVNEDFTINIMFHEITSSLIGY